MTLHPELAGKLKNLKTKYAQVTAFAKLLPMFESQIIMQESTGGEYVRLSDRYKAMPLSWGINWFTNKPLNYPDLTCPYNLVSVYINTLNLFDERVSDFSHQELGRLVGGIKVHFYDAMNTTFYFLPHEIEDGMEKIYGWFLNIKSKSDEVIKAAELVDLERRIAKLKGL